MGVISNYKEVEQFVKSGDIIAVKATGIYKFLLGAGLLGSYGHIAIIDRIDANGVRPYVIQEDPGGGSIVPLDFYCNDTFDIIRLASPMTDYEVVIPQNAIIKLQSMPDYNYSEIAELVLLGLRRRWAKIRNKPLPTLPVLNPKNGQICSVFVSNVLYASGVYLQNTMYPSAVVDALKGSVTNYIP